jgi:hypothetical protein
MNNNTTFDICVDNLTYDTSLHVSTVIWRVSGLISVIIGIPGHIIQILLLSNKSNRREPAWLYFLVIPICELVFLLGLYEFQIWD